MPLRFAIETNSWVTVSREGRLAGPLGPKLEKFWFLPQNSTFIDLQHWKKPFIEALGSKSDVIRGMSDPSELPTNLTVGPPFEALDCFLVSKVIGKKEQKVQSFGELLKTINLEVKVSIIIFLCIMMLILKFLSSISIFRVSWKLFLLIFDRKYEDLSNNRKVMKIALVVTIFILFIKILLSSLVNTEMIILDHGRRINTFDELAKSNLTLQFSDQIACEEAIRHRLRSLHGVRIDHTRTRRSSIKLWFLVRSLDSCALIEGHYLEYMIPTFCTYSEPGEIFLEHIHRSKKPVISQAHMLYFHKSLERFDREYAIGWAYANMELGIYSMTGRFGLKTYQIFSSIPNMRCTQDEAKNPIAKPLGIQFLESFVRFQRLVCILAFLIFCLEYLLYLTYEQ